MRDQVAPPGGGFWADADVEQALQRFRTLVDMVDDGVYQLDAAGRFVAVNDAIVDLTGYERPELLGEHASLVVADEDVGRIRHEIGARLGDEAPGDEALEFTARTADGAKIPCELELRPLVEDGSFRGTIGIARDITDRKRTERALHERERELRQKERRYEAIFEDPNILVGLLDPDGTVLDINGTAMEYVDADLEALLGAPFWETPWWGAGDDVESAVRDWTERAADGEYVDFEADLTRPDGERYVISGYFRPVTNDDGEVVSIIVSDRDVTERKERERELEESEHRYRTLVENFPNGAVALVDEEFRYVTFGGTPEGDGDLTSDDLEGEPVSDALPPELADVVVPRYEAALDGESARFEDTVGDRVYQFHFLPVRDDDGDVFAALGMSQDVTERDRTKRELERALDLLNKTERIADVAGWEVDPATNEPYWTDHLFNILDVDYDEQPSIDQALDVYYTDEDRAIVEDAIETALETGDSFDVEARFPKSDGNVGWLRVKGDPEVEDGEVVTLRGAVQDVTERTEREQALQESRNQLQALIDVLPVAVFVAEADGEIVEWNEAAEEIWGGEVAEPESVAEYEAYDAWWADSGEPLDPHEWPLARALEGEEVTDPDEIEIEGFDGERRIVLNHGTPVRDADGEVSRAVVTLVDITERKEYQRRLEASNERLEQFAYAASHDLQEPLRMVSSYLQLLEHRYADDLEGNGREFIEFAVDGAERMREMIEALLEYSRVETQGEPFEPVDLRAIFDDVLEDLRLQIEESDAEITAASLPTVRGDANQLRQVFQNLLDNAIEYSGAAAPRIHVGAERAGDRWRISVSDQGIGIDPDYQDDIFEVFNRLHSRDEHAGTGIGLALCSRIVERHGGEIRVDSDPGEGTTFAFTLPAATERDRA